MIDRLKSMMPSPRVRRVFGLGIMAVSLLFVAKSAADADIAAFLAELAPAQGASLFLLSAGYGLSLALLALGWRALLAGSGAGEPARRAIIVYGASILPKYLPGSVFQYVSRQALGAAMGWRQRDMAFASLAEIGLHVLASLLVFGAAAMILGLPFGGGAIVGSLGAVALAGGVWLRSRGLLGCWSLSLALQLLFFAGMMLFAAACATLIGSDPAAAFEAGALFLLAWLVGFAVPGVPGGIGVREALLIWLVTPALGAEPALLFAASTRVITFVGDVLFAALALALQRSAAARSPFEEAGAGKA